MTTTTRYILPFVAIGIISGAFVASAVAHPGDRLAEQLGLSEAQQQSLASLRAEYAPRREVAQAQREQVHASRKRRRRGEEGRRTAQRAERAAMAESLPPEQLEKWKKPSRERGGGRMGEGGGGGGEGGGGGRRRADRGPHEGIRTR